jgi:hypothetical protein
MYTTRCRISCNAFRPTVFITDRDQSPSMHRLEGQKSRSAVKRLKTRLSRNRRNASRAMSQSLLLEWSQFRPNTSGLELARVGRPTETSCVADHQVLERVFFHAYGFLSMVQPLGRTFRRFMESASVPTQIARAGLDMLCPLETITQTQIGHSGNARV